MTADPRGGFPVSTRWSSFAKQLCIVGGLAAAVWLIFRVRILWTPLILVFILSFVASYPVNTILRRTGWPRTFVVIISYLLLLLALALAAVSVAPRLVALGAGLSQTLQRVLFELARATPAPIEFTPTLILDVNELYAPIRRSLNGILNLDPETLKSLQDFLFPFASGAAAVVISALSGLVGTLFVLVSSFYLVKDWPRIGRFLLTRMPRQYRPELHQLWQEVAGVWDGFARGQLLAGLIMGFMVGLILSILGVRNSIALGLLAAFAEFLPAIGPVISATTGALIALTFASTWLPMSHLGFALVVLAFYLLLGQIQNLYVVPRIVGRRIDLHPLVIIIGAFVGAELLGILGMLLAAPTIASLRVLSGYAFNKLLDQDPFPASKRSVDQKALWRDLTAGRPIRAILFDLDGTLIETDDVAVERLARRLGFLERILPVATRKKTARWLLMSSEPYVNGLITLLDRLHLDGLLFRLDATLHRWRGIRPQDRFVAVAGTPAMLIALAARYPLGIVTSRNRAASRAFLAQCGLTEVVSVLVSRDDARRLKPHPLPIRLAAQRLAMPPEQCVMVGDTGVDVRAAKAAGALAVGVLCGFGDRHDLNAADLVLDSTAQVADWL
jgi:predicted PurR-regulated permease PerM/phosphoglycolate phosphatase-like HAD superfamily hydrolase